MKCDPGVSGIGTARISSSVRVDAMNVSNLYRRIVARQRAAQPA